MRTFLLLLASTIALAQPAKLQFEVASIKMNTERAGIGIAPRRSADRFTWTNAPLSLILPYAFDITFQELEGKLPQEFYNIEATLDPAASTEDARRMLQSLLEDRFQLRWHREQRPMDVFRLVIAPNGPRLKASTENSSVLVGGRPIPSGRAATILEQDGSHTVGHAATVAQLCAALSNLLGKPVLDHTGLTGAYDFDIVHGPETPRAAEFNLPPIRAVLQNAVGLRIESANAPISILVIDHIEAPSPN